MFTILLYFHKFRSLHYFDTVKIHAHSNTCRFLDLPHQQKDFRRLGFSLALPKRIVVVPGYIYEEIDMVK